MVFDRHGDRTAVIFLTKDPGDSVRFKIDLAMPAGEAARLAERGTGVKAPWGNPTTIGTPPQPGEYPAADRPCRSRQQRRHRQNYEPDSWCDVVAPHRAADDTR